MAFSRMSGTTLALQSSDLDELRVLHPAASTNSSSSSVAPSSSLSSIRPSFNAVAATEYFLGPEYSSEYPDLLTDYSVGESYTLSDYVPATNFEPAPDFEDHQFSHDISAQAYSVPSTASSVFSPLPLTPVCETAQTSSTLQQQQSNVLNRSPCLNTTTAAVAEEIAASTKRVRRRKNSISEKAAMINPDIRPPLHTIGSRKPLVLPELPPGKTKDDLAPEELANYKHVHRLLRNRIAALASREKKRMYIEHLESENEKLEEEKRYLDARVAELEKQVSMLESRARSDTAELNPQSLVKSDANTDCQFLKQSPRVGHSCSARLSQDEFDKITIASGLLFVLLYMTSSMTYPSLLTIPSLLAPPFATTVQDESTLSAQIYKILNSPAPATSQGYIQLAPNGPNTTKRPHQRMMFVTRAGIPDTLREGSAMSIITPVASNDAEAAAAETQLPSPPSPGALVREATEIRRRRRFGKKPASVISNDDPPKSKKRALLEEMEVVVKRRRVFLPRPI
ncbi:hypothetical protein BZA70DRAFT_146856 [Myxozyma melibiosi]|uniref:BZIP domain-containing protein n=1 Tax=Myxozyma melibiosi TaxID=54550 RepID=A0ABR1F7R1_9ASCO